MWKISKSNALISALFVLIANLAYPGSQTRQAQKIFVPYEPYVPEKREEYKQNIILNGGGCSEETIEAMLDHAEQTGYLFTTDNVVSTFPTILDSDILNIGCMGPQTRMEFLSVMSTNTLMAKTVVCDLSNNGMECLPPEETLRYFLVDPAKNFALLDGVTFEQGFEIIEWFRHDAGTVLTSEEKNRARQLSWRSVIGRAGTGYTFQVGDPYCECVLKFRLDAASTPVSQKNILVVGKPTFSCPERN